MRPDTSGTPFSSILCPIDFSEHSRLALRYAVSLARRSHGRLTVLFVNDPLLVAAAAAAYNTDTLGKASQEELARFVSETLRDEGLRGLQLDYQTTLGKPARQILRLVDDRQHDTVVLGTKGLRGAQRLFLGSTTSEVLRRTKVPVLAVPLADAKQTAPQVPPNWPGARILAPVALDEHTDGDLRHAADIAAWLKSSLLVLHVVPVPATPAWFQGDVHGQLQDLTEKARVALQAVAAPLRGECTTVVASGYPPDEIAREAVEQNAGLIVMTLRGGEGVLGTRVGSITYAVLSHDVAPVLALPGA